MGERRPARDEDHPALTWSELLVVVTEDGLQIFSLKKRDLPPEAFIMGEKADPLGVAVALYPHPRDGEKIGTRFHGSGGLGREVGRDIPPWAASSAKI